MTVIENQTTVACTPEELLDYCIDIGNELEWNPTAKSMEKLTDGQVGVDTRFLARWKGAPSAIEFERPHRWVHDNGGPIAVTFTGTVEAGRWRVAAPCPVRRGPARVPAGVPGVRDDGAPSGEGQHGPPAGGRGAADW